MIKFKNITHLFKNVNFDKMRDQISHLEHHLPKAGSPEGLSGWAVMGAKGKYTDGWVNGSNGKYLLKTENSVTINDSTGYIPNHFHTKYTDAASPEIIEFLEEVKKLELNPRRARLSHLAPGKGSKWHYDGDPDTISLRLHAVIRTNPESFFMTEEGEVHLPQDNIFLINVNVKHAVVNRGHTARTHLIADVYDNLNLFGRDDI